MDKNIIPDYLVIGSGLAALSASALLVKAGYKVTMLEAHTAAGGYAHTFEVDHFQFCAQVHYIWGCAPGQTIYEFLKKLVFLQYSRTTADLTRGNTSRMRNSTASRFGA